ncbi:MAG: hypothetical protein KGN79_02395 [Acidobacteriota bacterium]|nr:hypothetical protein [Acidobacteriota bacterium]
MRRAAEMKLAEVKAAFNYLKEEKNVAAEREDAQRNKAVGEVVPEQSPRFAAFFKNPSLQRLVTLVALLIAVTAGAFAIDFVLSSLPATAPGYTTFKINFKNAFMARMDGVMHPNKASGAEAAPPAKSAENPGDAQASTDHSASRESNRALLRDLANVPHVSGAQAYVTLGLTPQEVAAVLGPPTSASSKALTYGGSSIYLRDGCVSGWKVDPAAHLPVRMWPRHPVDPDLDTFTTGSTKDQVIFVQGTPSLVTDDKFGYGNSQVFFQGGKVVGWLNSPGSTHLKVHEE